MDAVRLNHSQLTYIVLNIVIVSTVSNSHSPTYSRELLCGYTNTIYSIYDIYKINIYNL